MKKIFAILALVGVVAVGSAQDITKPGLYDKYGKVANIFFIIPWFYATKVVLFRMIIKI